MYEGNNGFPKWQAEKLIAAEIGSGNENMKYVLLGGVATALLAGVVASGIECVNPIGPGFTCNTELLGINYHEHIPTGTRSIAFWSAEIGSLIDRAGAA